MNKEKVIDLERCKKCKGACCFIYVIGFFSYENLKNNGEYFPESKSADDCFKIANEVLKKNISLKPKIQTYSKYSKYSFKKHVEMWDEIFDECGASKTPPLFDPIKANQPESFFERLALIKNGMHSLKCKYCGRDGCILAWNKRPDVCTTFKCSTWENEGK